MKHLISVSIAFVVIGNQFVVNSLVVSSPPAATATTAPSARPSTAFTPFYDVLTSGVVQRGETFSDEQLCNHLLDTGNGLKGALFNLEASRRKISTIIPGAGQFMDETKPVPLEYNQAMICINDICQYVKENSKQLYSCIRFIPKKNGLGPQIAIAIQQAEEQAVRRTTATTTQFALPTFVNSPVATKSQSKSAGAAAAAVRDFPPLYQPQTRTEIIMESVERALSEMEVVVSTSNALELKSSVALSCYLWGLKPILEHSAVRTRLRRIITYSKTFFAPYWARHPNPIFDMMLTKESMLDSYMHMIDRAKQSKDTQQTAEESTGEVVVAHVESPSPAARLAAKGLWPFIWTLRKWDLLQWQLATKPKKPAKKNRRVLFGNDSKDDETDKETLSEVDVAALAAAAEDARRLQEEHNSMTTEAFVIALMEADPSGEAMNSLADWIVGMQCTSIENYDDGDENISDRYRLFLSARDVFQEGKKKKREKFLDGFRMMGLVSRLLLGAFEKENLRGEKLIQRVNYIMLVLTIAVRLPSKSAAKRPFELAMLHFSEDVTSDDRTFFAEFDAALAGGLAAMLHVTVDDVKSDACQKAISKLLLTWKSPHLLVHYHNIHRKSVGGGFLEAYQRFLQSLLACSTETIDDIRYRDPRNAAHLSKLPPKMKLMWEDADKKLPGTTDIETLFRMGEDTKPPTCLAITTANLNTNSCLLAYLIQGNVRLIIVKDKDKNALLGRAVVRLLYRKDTMEPVLFMEDAYYAFDTTGGARRGEEAMAAAGDVTSRKKGGGGEVEKELQQEADRLASLLGIPLYRWGDVVPRPLHSSSTSQAAADGGGSEDDVSQGTKLIELDGLAPYVYSDGIRRVPPTMATGVLERMEVMMTSELAIGYLPYSNE